MQIARVAVIIPCFGDGPLLPETLASVREEEPIEIVVVDDASVDEETHATLDHLEAEGLRVIRRDQNRGAAAARATGLEATSAPFVFPLDADDLAVPGLLARMADRLEQDPPAAVCFGDYEEFGDTNLVRAVPDQIDAYRLAYVNEYPITALFRRSVLTEVGGWGSGFAYEDWHLWMSLAEQGAAGIHMGKGVVTYRRRLHGHRLLTGAKRSHPEHYARLRAHHPRLFRELASHRKRSDLHTARKLLYPVVYGGRRRFGWEPKVKALLDRSGAWTLRR